MYKNTFWVTDFLIDWVFKINILYNHDKFIKTRNSYEKLSIILLISFFLLGKQSKFPPCIYLSSLPTLQFLTVPTGSLCFSKEHWLVNF